MKKLFIICVVLLAACNDSTDQSKICKTDVKSLPQRCKAGDLVWIQAPNSNNLRLIAQYCDTNQPIQSDHDGVICTYNDQRQQQF